MLQISLKINGSSSLQLQEEWGECYANGSLLGIKVIGMVSDLSKVYDKSNSGCESIFVYHDKNLYKKIMKLTENRRVDFIFDSVGSSKLFELIGYFEIMATSSIMGKHQE